MNQGSDLCPYCKEPMFSITQYENHVKTEHIKGKRGHVHKYIIPIEWATNNQDSQYGIWTQVIKLRCMCGDEIKRSSEDTEDVHADSN